MESMLLSPVCEPEVRKELQNLDPSKSCEHDNILPRVVKYLASELSEPFTHIINLSFITGNIPVDMKTTIIIPVYKAGDNREFTNYRPISLLPCFSKVLEKMMNKRLVNYLNKVGILSEHQFGFRKNYSTNFALIDLVNRITTTLDNKEFTIGVFLDLSKAFDTVNHDLLLQKLELYGIRGIVLEWFKNYITKRYQCVRYNNELSEKKEMKCGVPQGSILGPLLFLIYINDICNSSELVSFILFADDTNLLMSHLNLNTLIDKVNEELEKISIWLQINKLSLNLSKTHFILFKSSRKKLGNEIKIRVKDKSISQVGLSRLC